MARASKEDRVHRILAEMDKASNQDRKRINTLLNLSPSIEQLMHALRRCPDDQKKRVFARILVKKSRAKKPFLLEEIKDLRDCVGTQFKLADEALSYNRQWKKKQQQKQKHCLSQKEGQANAA